MDPRTPPTTPPFAPWFGPQFTSWTAQYPPVQVAPQAFAVCKTALDTWLAVTNAALSGAERIRMAQLATDVETMGQNHRAAIDLAASKDLPGVFAVQAGLARAYLDGCTRYWTAVAEAMQATQAEMTDILSARAGNATGAAPRAAVRPASVDRKAA